MKIKLVLFAAFASVVWLCLPAMEPVDYVMPEVGSDSSGDFSNGNTYPAIARPWGMNFWNWSGEPWRCQYWVREAMDMLYQPRPDGFCGDDDTGQTSAWFVYSALGFYPVCPGTGEYVIGSPIFDRAMIAQPGGKTLVIEAKGASRANRYVEKVVFNGKPVDVNYVKFADLRKGGRLVFTMSDRPNKSRGVSPKFAPYSYSQDKDYVK